MVNQNNINKFFLFLITIFNILTPTYLEFQIFGLETSYEFLIYTVWILYGTIESFYSNKSKISINLVIYTSLIFYMIFFELFFKNNFKAVYEINFIFLLFSLYKFQQVKDFVFLRKLILLNLIIFICLLIFTNYSFTEWDLRKVGSELIKRKSLYGYVSISLSIMIVFSMILILELIKQKVFNKFILFTFFIIFFYYLIMTFSRTGALLLIIYFIYNLIFIKNKINILFSILVFIFVFYFFSNLSFSDYFSIFSNLTDNIRLRTWRSELFNFINLDPVKIMFGDNFFNKSIDNTFITILIGKGLIGFIIYLFFFRSLYLNLINEKNQHQIRIIKISFILLLISFNFMEFFGQRKIIFLLSLYTTFMISIYNEKNNYPRRY